MLENLGHGRFTNASGIVAGQGLPKIIGRGLAAADFDNNGRMGVAINTIGGPLVLLEDEGPVGHWLEVSLKGFQAGAVLTATLPNGHTDIEELHDGSSYLSSEDPRAHFGLGTETRVSRLTIRWPDGQRLASHEHRGKPDHHRRTAGALSRLSLEALTLRRRRSGRDGARRAVHGARAAVAVPSGSRPWPPTLRRGPDARRAARWAQATESRWRRARSAQRTVRARSADGSRASGRGARQRPERTWRRRATVSSVTANKRMSPVTM